MCTGQHYNCEQLNCHMLEWCFILCHQRSVIRYEYSWRCWSKGSRCTTVEQLTSNCLSIVAAVATHRFYNGAITLHAGRNLYIPYKEENLCKRSICWLKGGVQRLVYQISVTKPVHCARSHLTYANCLCGVSSAFLSEQWSAVVHLQYCVVADSDARCW